VTGDGHQSLVTSGLATGLGAIELGAQGHDGRHQRHVGHAWSCEGSLSLLGALAMCVADRQLGCRGSLLFGLFG
jgi:hypothetical protein